MISFDTLIKRAGYGGRKGRAARRRLSGKIYRWVYGDGTEGSIEFKVPKIPITREPLQYVVSTAMPLAFAVMK